VINNPNISARLLPTFAVELRIEAGVVIHFELAVNFEAARAHLQLFQQFLKAIFQVAKLFL
jgi:hypothetical protein